jgi:arylsulfatase A
MNIPRILFFSLSLLTLAPSRTPAAKRPNIVLILADDLGWGEVGVYGQKKMKTPNIDRLARDGIRFTQFYSGSSVCAPARCTLMTGYHTGHAQVRGNLRTGGSSLGLTNTGQHPLSEGTVTIGHLLQQRGYRTGAIGKWGLGRFDNSGSPAKQGFDYYFGYLCQLQAHTHYPNHLWRNGEIVKIPENDAGWNGTKHSHDLMTEESLKFIDDNADKPFFLYVAYAIPHVSIQATSEATAEYAGKFDEPKAYKGSRTYIPHETPRTGYAAMIQMLDRDVGRIMYRLKAKGIADDTLVLFTSDNGPTFNGGSDSAFFDSAGPFGGLKVDLYEGGIRVPLIARWPGKIRANTVSLHPAAFWDFLPTLAEVVHAKPPQDIDGLSFLPALLGKSAPQHRSFYWEFTGAQAVRMGDWKLVKNSPRRAGIARKDRRTELFNLAADPGERHDLAPQMPDKIKELEAEMARQHTPSKHFPLIRQTKK